MKYALTSLKTYSNVNPLEKLEEVYTPLYLQPTSQKCAPRTLHGIMSILIYQMSTPNSTQVLRRSSCPANKTPKSEKEIINTSSAFSIIINPSVNSKLNDTAAIT